MNFLENALVKRIHASVAREEYFEETGDAFYLVDQVGRKQHSVMFDCKFDETAKLFLSLPTITKNIYVTITDGDPKLVRYVIGAIEDHEIEECAHIGDVILLDAPALRKFSICGVMLLAASLFHALDHVPNHLIFDGEEYKFVSVCFLTDFEHGLWKQEGHDALMDYFTKTEKDLISFGLDMN
ncbi:MAG: hypothetical protein V4631_13045 [Pseudomonadota bacterium]